MALAYDDLDFVSVSIGVLQDVEGNTIPATVTFEPVFDRAIHLASHNVIYGTVINRKLEGGAITETLLASDTGGLSVTDFDWIITLKAAGLTGRAADKATFTQRVRLLKAAPAVDLDLVQVVPQPTQPQLNLPVVTSVAGFTGAVTEEQLASLGLGGGGGGGGGLSDAGVAALVGNENSATGVALGTRLQATSTALRTELLGGAGPAFDTLGELKALLDAAQAGDATSLTALLTAVGLKANTADVPQLALDAVTSSGAYAPLVARKRMPLRYAPPAQVVPTVVAVPTGYYAGTFGEDEDVLLLMPATQRTSTLTITGGRHVRLIGGSTKKSTTGASIAIRGVTGSIFIEGTEVDASLNTGDAINAHGRHLNDPDGPTYPDVYIQNCRLVGLNGGAAGVHSDMYQPQGPIGRLSIDKLSGTSNYQGIFLRAEYPVTETRLSRVDLAYTDETGTTYLLWHYSPGQDDPAPLVLDEVYITPRPGQNVAAHGMYPSAGVTDGGLAVGAVAGDGNTTGSWPARSLAKGIVTAGEPPGGAFVPAGLAGPGYVSPGYLGATPSQAGELSTDATSVNGVAVTGAPTAGQVLTADDPTGASWATPSPVPPGPVEDEYCHTFAPELATTSAAMTGANRTFNMRLKGSKAGATKVRLLVGTASGNVSVAIYPNNGLTGRDARPAGPAKALVGSTALSSVVSANNTSGTLTLPEAVDVEGGDWVALSCDNTTATFARPQANVVHTDALFGRLYTTTTAFPTTTTPKTDGFVSTPFFWLGVE